MRWIRFSAVIVPMALAGCSSGGKPFIAIGSTQKPAESVAPTTEPVATSALGTIDTVPGVKPKPRPFVAVPRVSTAALASPSTLLLEHAVPESPVPLSEYGRQPVHHLGEFNLRLDLSAAELEKKLGKPAQLADNDDPWIVYRLDFGRELWLHFVGPSLDRLDAADVVRGAEDGYVRDRVFSADEIVEGRASKSLRK